MIDLINQLEKPGPNTTPEQRQEYNAKLARYVFVKEQHAEIAKSEVRILWGDYFKPDHLKTFPDLHDLVWKALKSGSKARQEINLQAAEDLLKATNDIASIYWKTKGSRRSRSRPPIRRNARRSTPSSGRSGPRVPAMFPLRRFRIEDESMRPTLEPGDYVLVNRWAYRVRPPRRGDLVVVRDPAPSDRFLVN